MVTNARGWDIHPSDIHPWGTLPGPCGLLMKRNNKPEDASSQPMLIPNLFRTSRFGSLSTSLPVPGATTFVNDLSRKRTGFNRLPSLLKSVRARSSHGKAGFAVRIFGLFFSSENDFNRIGGQFVWERDDLWEVGGGGKRK